MKAYLSGDEITLTPDNDVESVTLGKIVSAGPKLAGVKAEQFHRIGFACNDGGNAGCGLVVTIKPAE